MSDKWSDREIVAYELGMQTEREHQNALSRLAMEAHERKLAALRAERDQWQQRAEGAVYALMLTEPHMLAGNLTEWIANCAQALEAQGRRLAELERAVVWRPAHDHEHTVEFTEPSGYVYLLRYPGKSEEYIMVPDGYAICRRITQERDDGTQNDAH